MAVVADKDVPQPDSFAKYAKGMTNREIELYDADVSPALGINIEGQKELLGMWRAENEGAKFLLSVLTESRSERHSHCLCGIG